MSRLLELARSDNFLGDLPGNGAVRLVEAAQKVVEASQNYAHKAGCPCRLDTALAEGKA